MPEGTLKLRVRARLAESGEWTEAIVEKELPISQTAILICDMWDMHW
ncbi:MAG TPA: hypothetical protein PKY01_15330 [Candidatus Hydrogenedentes bacterium]|nr:hypothetical protein [Candidatus Hydrogenedentota bacterium]HQH53801.1 hypothetical protein [Candidatus Hydrogenedentota bacterium]